MLVVGAGPAGLGAAAMLAAERAAVLVLEEHDAVGDPVHCTGIVGLDAFDELDLPRHTICTVSRLVRFVGRSGRDVVVDGGGMAAAVIDRGRFDRALAARATAAGASLVTGARVQRLEVTPHGVEAVVQLADGAPGRARGRVCVLACGTQYRFNRQLGLGIPRVYLQSAQVETGFVPADVVEIDLDRSLAPRGFAWVVPFRRGDADLARVGLMAGDRAAARFGDYARRLAVRYSADVLRSPPRLKLLPLAPVSRTYADRVIAVGDAAGLTKPTTGGGIYYSLLSGRFAAEILTDSLKHDRTRASALRQYETLWRSRLGPEFRAGLAFRSVAARLDDGAVEALLELAAIDGIVPLLRRTADVNWHSRAAIALLRHPGFRRILLKSLWA